MHFYTTLYGLITQVISDHWKVVQLSIISFTVFVVQYIIIHDCFIYVHICI